MRVIWIDPGETVGWVIAQVTDEPSGWHLDVLDYGSTKLKRFALALLDGAHKYDVIGYETYVIQPAKLAMHAGSTVPTLQLIGMIRLAFWNAQLSGKRYGAKIVEQPPLAKSKGRGAAKLHLSDELNAAIQDALEGAHDDGHHGDALLHLAAWFHDYTTGAA